MISSMGQLEPHLLPLNSGSMMEQAGAKLSVRGSQLGQMRGILDFFWSLLEPFGSPIYQMEANGAFRSFINHCKLFSRRVILSDLLPHPFGLTLLGSHIYWTDWTLKGVYRAEKHTGANQQVLVRGLPKRPMDIHVYSTSRQEQCKDEETTKR